MANSDWWYIYIYMTVLSTIPVVHVGGTLGLVVRGDMPCGTCQDAPTSLVECTGQTTGFVGQCDWRREQMVHLCGWT